MALLAPDLYEQDHAKSGQYILAKWATAPQRWLISVGGHHGAYQSLSPRGSLRNRADHPALAQIRSDLLQEFCELFGPEPDEAVEESPRLHWFTGWMIFCDWIGSSSQWFPFNDLGPLTADTASKRATGALHAIGWSSRSVLAMSSFQSVFGFSPRPLQASLLEAADCRGLYIVEAPMGVGKTEAALAVAHQRWSKGDERGLYFALPTQLTSNRIHERIQCFLERVVENPTALALVHGNAWLGDQRITPILPASPDRESVAEAAEVNRWFSDSRKSLLAPFGTGTIDQALLSVLPAKFSALRLFALSGKVIVIDEVHSYDPYTSAILDRAVSWLIETGSTIIILSATLTAKRRAELVAAAGAVEREVSDSYPLVTKVPVGATHATTISPPADDSRSQTITIEHIDPESAIWIDEAVNAAEAGACVLIVRNTIASAQQTYREVVSRCRSGLGINFGLLHSRFPQFRREQNESRWMQLLGKGDGARPKGAILIGTQVLEQSIDIDADILITDLAPTDLILQRIGRLHRHLRPRPEGYLTPRCLILIPSVDWNLEMKTIRNQLGASSYVYPSFSLYQAQRVWRALTSIRLPAQIRPVLEESHRVPDELPCGAQAALEELNSLIEKMQNTAWMTDVFKLPAVDDTKSTQTRWNSQASGWVVMLRDDVTSASGLTRLEFLNGETIEFTPGQFDFNLARQLHLNACRVPIYLIRDSMSLGIQPAWLHQHMPSAILAYGSSESIECRFHAASAQPAYRLFYREDIGLWHERTEAAHTLDSDEEESWF